MPIHKKDGRISQKTIMRDVTDYYNALEEKNKAEQQLIQAQKMESLGQLAAGIAHEINTPIQYVRDNANFLQAAFSDFLTVVKYTDRLLDAVKSGSICLENIEKIETALTEADIDYHKKEIPLAIQQAIDGVGRVSKIVQSMKEFSHPGGEEVLFDINHALMIVDKYKGTLTCESEPGKGAVFIVWLPIKK